MRVLAIETASEACSVALVEDGQVVGQDHRILGRGHAEQLVPMIAELPGRGRAQRIHVSLGPGSFTGVRIGIAAARALGVAWKAEVLGYPTLALLAQIAAQESPDGQILVCVHGGHGEWFVQPYAGREAQAPVVSMKPADAVGRFAPALVIGSRAEEFVTLKGSGEARQRLPDAIAAAMLGPDVLTRSLGPIYGRGPDATPQVRS